MSTNVVWDKSKYNSSAVYLLLYFKWFAFKGDFITVVFTYVKPKTTNILKFQT